MAYLSFKEYQTTASGLFDFICSSIVSMGWTLHDTVSGSNKVYKSNGELGDRIYEYIELYNDGGGTIFKAWGYWNNSTHVGSNGAYQNTVNYKINSGSEWVSVSGNKDLVFVRNWSTTTNYIYFGHIPQRYYPTPIATLQNNEASGSNVVVELDNVTGFKKTFTYMIFGAAGEGRDNVVVNDINIAGNTVTITSLPRNYNSGSKIGITPSTFGVSINTNVNTFYPTCHRNFAGGTGAMASGNTWICKSMFTYTAIDPEANCGLYVLTPFYWVEETNRDIIGYPLSTSGIYSSPLATIEYLWDISSGQKEQGFVTSGGNNTLTDSSKSWGTNVLANKIVIIVDGAGVGQTRKIASNTGTVITTTNNWSTNPDATSIYRVADEVYRTTFAVSGFSIVTKEIL
jgi:hypothetical protein